MPENEIRLLTLNCWGLKYVSKNRNERVAALAVELAKPRYDVILLQELWVQTDYEFIRDHVSARLPHAKAFYSGALGAGLSIFSRFPITETAIHPYSLNGAPTDVFAGDWMVGKAAASVVISHPILGHVQIFNTHLFAKSGEGGVDHVKAHSLVNAWEFSKLALHAAQLGRHVIAAGDFNSLPTSLSMTIIRDHARLTDAWTATDHSSAATATSPPSSSSSRRSPDPVQDAIHKYGITADSPLNTYTAGKPLDAHAREHLGKRLDYIFYRNPLRADYDPDAALLTAKETKVVFTGKVPQYDFSFSDHFGLECTFEVRTYGDTDSHPGSPFEPLRESALSPASISSTIQMLTSAYRLSVARARRELTTCALCVLVLCGAVVGSAWLPPRSWVAPLLLLCTIFVAWLATTMLYEGFIYGRWEQNALRSLIEELEVHRKVVLLRERQQRASP